MGWGWLKPLGAIGAAVAAPFTAGTSLAALPAILGAGSAALGGASQAKATNRGSQFDGQLALAKLLMERDASSAGLNADADRDYFNQSVAREQEGRASGSDAWRKLLAAQHTLSPGATPHLSPYSVAPRQATGAERQGADAMVAEVMARLQGGNPIAAPRRRDVDLPNDPRRIIDPNLLRAGAGESTMGWLSALLGGLGAAGSARTMPHPSTNTFSGWVNPDLLRGARF